MNAKVKTDEFGQEYKEVGYDKERFDLTERMFMNVPMTYSTMAEMAEIEGDKELYNNALYLSMMFGGPNVQILGSKKEDASGPPKLPSMPSLPKLPKMP